MKVGGKKIKNPSTCYIDSTPTPGVFEVKKDKQKQKPWDPGGFLGLGV